MEPASEPSRPASSGAPLAVEVTARCNRACVYCYNGLRASGGPSTIASSPEPSLASGEKPSTIASSPEPSLAPGDELPAAELVPLVNRVLEATGRRVVQISGGEPMLRPDLFEIIEKLRATGRVISLVTDGGLIDDAATARLKELKVGPVQPTLLAARREVHDHLKGTPSFDATVAAIVRLKKAGVPVSVSFVCTRTNHAHFRDVVELCFALGVQTVAYSRFCNAGAGASAAEELTPTPDMVADNLDVATWAGTALGMTVNVAISLPLCLPREKQRAVLKFGRCALATESPGYTIDPWGRLRACSVSPIVLGDLRSETWEAIQARARDGYFSEVAALPDDCRGCSMAGACGGGCRESARMAYGTLDRADPLARLGAS